MSYPSVPPPGQYYDPTVSATQGDGYQQGYSGAPPPPPYYGQPHQQHGGHHPHSQHHAPSHAAYPATPSSGAIALIPSMITPQETRLTIKTDGTKKIKDSSGREVLQVKEHSWSSKTDILTASGQLLFTVKPHSKSKDHVYDFETASGQIALNISKKGFIKERKEIHFRNAVPPYENVTLELLSKGKKAFGASRNGKVVIDAKREEHVFHDNVLNVIVKPGVDIALAAALMLLSHAEMKRGETAAATVDAAGSIAGAGA